MNNTTIEILSTKKIDAELKQFAFKNGINIVDYNFLEYTYLDTKEIVLAIAENKNPFVFTSQHAVNAVTILINKYNISLLNKTCFTINGATTHLALANGFEVIDTATNSIALAEKIIHKKKQQVLFCCGNIRLQHLNEILTKNSILIAEIEVYRKILMPIKIDGKIDGILFFSPSQIDAFMLKNSLPLDTPAFCIGDTTAKYLQLKNHLNFMIAKSQSVTNVIKTAIDYYASL
ncbi:MAG: hypothetical protein RJA07_1782 [Bacteroidota bacterium]|jgi:uroporphyrinogen-III synthase